MALVTRYLCDVTGDEIDPSKDVHAVVTIEVKNGADAHTERAYLSVAGLGKLQSKDGAGVKLSTERVKARAPRKTADKAK